MYRLGTVLALAFTLAVAMLLSFAVQRAAAGGTVTNCADDAELSAKLATGGTVEFDCGTATITLSSTKTITTDTTIDGGGRITLSGGNGLRLFIVNSGASLTLRNIVLTGGYSPSSNGGAVVSSGSVTLEGTTIRDSTNSSFSGGAIATTGPLTITNSALVNNKAGNGGAIFATGAAARVTISESELYGNSVSSNIPDNSRGGAIYLTNGANATISATEIYSNTALDGGGVANFNSTVSFVGATLTDNQATSRGAGLLNYQGTANFRDSTLRGNRGGIGGGINNTAGTLTVLDSTLIENHERLPGYSGGGLLSDGFFGPASATLTNVTIANNTAGGGGAGIGNAFGSTMQLTNVTISGNTAGNTGGQGGGINNYRATLMLTNVTLVGNSAPSGAGGGIYNENHPDTALSLRNVIVADSVSGGNCGFGKLPETSLFNLSSDATCAFGSGRDSVDVRLGPLANNGGPTMTHLPQPDSPAIDSGTAAACPARDQRGVERYIGPTCDVGAVELGAKPVLTAISPSTAAVDDPPVVLSLTGSGFLTGATALWNGSPLSTTFISSNALTATIPTANLAAGGVYTVSVRHGDVPAETSESRPFTVTKLTQTIQFEPILDRTFGDAPFTVSATASSGLPVSFSASGSCTVSGQTVTLTGGGSCTIVASQDGDERYNPAPNVSRTFSIAASGPTSTPTTSTGTATPTPEGTPTPIPGTPGAFGVHIAVVLVGSEAGW